MKAQNDVPKSKLAREEKKNDGNPKGEKQARMRRKKDRRPRARAREERETHTRTASERFLNGETKGHSARVIVPKQRNNHLRTTRKEILDLHNRHVYDPQKAEWSSNHYTAGNSGAYYKFYIIVIWIDSEKVELVV